MFFHQVMLHVQMFIEVSAGDMFFFTYWANENVVCATVKFMIDGQMVPQLGLGCENPLTLCAHVKHLMALGMSLEGHR